MLELIILTLNRHNKITFLPNMLNYMQTQLEECLSYYLIWTFNENFKRPPSINTHLLQEPLRTRLRSTKLFG